ncbi:MAG TPA: DUF2891 domain-containing protein [Gemmatimonadaceae bacterium]|nr:DUF2891 domain-containing protein [Gemmatimonadaceae bacterium]
MLLTPELASKFAGVALAHLTREYPHKLDHVLDDAGDVRSPRELHPVFYGSFDWHSCVHGYWLLATMLRRFPAIGEAERIASVLEAQLTASNVEEEADYFRRPSRGTFERPYGWAWLLMLDAELSRHDTSEARGWRSALSPLTRVIVERYTGFLPRATYPVRVGTHFNSAFGLALAIEYGSAMNDEGFRGLLIRKAVEWYGSDRDCQAWEPGGDDFLSSALVEAECMRRALEPDAFGDWLSVFLPNLGSREPATLFVPATVTDRSDGKIAHLDGLNLSRAWCWRSLAETFGEGDPRREIAVDAARAHLDAGLPHVTGDYMGEHWLATFAVLALR